MYALRARVRKACVHVCERACMQYIYSLKDLRKLTRYVFFLNINILRQWRLVTFSHDWQQRRLIRQLINLL